MTITTFLACLTLAASSTPGDLITIYAEAKDRYSLPVTTYIRLGVVNPVYDKPVYMCRPKGNPAGYGMRRVWYQRVGAGFERHSGVQLKNGNVLTDGGRVMDLDKLQGAY